MNSPSVEAFFNRIQALKQQGLPADSARVDFDTAVDLYNELAGAIAMRRANLGGWIRGIEAGTVVVRGVRLEAGWDGPAA